MLSIHGFPKTTLVNWSTQGSTNVVMVCRIWCQIQLFGPPVFPGVHPLIFGAIDHRFGPVLFTSLVAIVGCNKSLFFPQRFFFMWLFDLGKSVIITLTCWFNPSLSHKISHYYLIISPVIVT